MSTAYAGSLTIGAQINPGIKYQGGNTAIETMKYYVDFGPDTKAFFVYNDKDVTGKLVLITKDVNGTKGNVGVGVALLKIKKLLGLPVSMTIGKQPTFVDNYDFSILGVHQVNADKKATLAKVIGVSLGYNAGIANVQLLMVNNGKSNPNVTKLARIFEQAELGTTVKLVKGTTLGFAFDTYINDDDKEYLVYLYFGLSKDITPVFAALKTQFSYDKKGDGNVYDIALEADMPAMKLVFKPAQLYGAVQYAHGNADSGLNYDFAVKAGAKIKYSSNVVHNDYIKFEDKSKVTTWEVGSDWVIKFAKTIK
jgi:hypothetical protein